MIACVLFWPIAFCPVDKQCVPAPPSSPARAPPHESLTRAAVVVSWRHARSHVQYVIDAAGHRTPYNAAVHGYPVVAGGVPMAAPGAVQMNPMVAATPAAEPAAPAAEPAAEPKAV